MKSLLVVLVGALVAIPAFAMTLTVTSTRDDEDCAPGDGRCADSTGVCTLRAAIEEANALSGPDVINIPAGTYRLTRHGAEEDACATGDLDVTDDLTLFGAGEDATIIDGDGADRVFEVFAANFVGMTIQNGYDPLWGAGIAGGYVTLLNTRLADNDGCGLASDADVSVESSIIEQNSAGGVDSANGAQVSDSLVSGNGNGAGVAAPGAVVLRSLVENHETCGVMVYEGVPFGNGSVVDSTLRGNATGVCSSACSSLDVEGSSITDNDVGLQVSQCFGFQIAKSTVSENRGDGFVVVDDQGGYGSSLESVTVARNGGYGVRVAGNQGGCAPIAVHNSILAGNAEGECGGDCPLQSTGFNVIWNGSGCCLEGDTVGNMVGLDPKLDGLADNGGPTETQALLAGSVAIDAGDPAGCGAADQRGSARPQGDACDIGAYESLCSTAPHTDGCFTDGLSRFQVRDGASALSDKMSWRWLSDEEASLTDFGNPQAGTSYSLCVYDHAGETAALAQALVIPAGRRWSPTAAPGFRMRDESGARDGVTSTKLRLGANGGSRLELKAEGPDLSLPHPASATRFFAQEPAVVVQLINSDGQCWTAEYTPQSTLENAPGTFRAKAP